MCCTQQINNFNELKLTKKLIVDEINSYLMIQHSMYLTTENFLDK